MRVKKLVMSKLEKKIIGRYNRFKKHYFELRKTVKNMNESNYSTFPFLQIVMSKIYSESGSQL